MISRRSNLSGVDRRKDDRCCTHTAESARLITFNSAYGGTAIDAAYILQIDAKTIHAAHILQMNGNHSAHGGTIKERSMLHTYCRSMMVF